MGDCPPSLLRARTTRLARLPWTDFLLSLFYIHEADMNPDSINYQRPYQGFLSSTFQSALNDDPLDPPHSTANHSRPPSLFLPQHQLPYKPHPHHHSHSRSSSSSTIPAHDMSAAVRPLPPTHLDDPAFSDDPEENPHFAMSSLGDFLPANTAAIDIVSPYASCSCEHSNPDIL